VIELIDDPKVLDALADQARAGDSGELAKKRAERAVAALKNAIEKTKETRKSRQ
jgi:hypothetical protein